MEQVKAFSYIRFSTPEQSKGRSQARQLEGAVDYCRKHNLALDETLSFQDLGVSAFRGRNLEEGAALGAFLKAVRDGTVPKGSYLLVESLDRVSRQAARRAANTMGEIVDEGVTVIDLSDGGREYSAEILDEDPMAFLMMIVRFMRANEESQRKSERLTDAWAKKKKSANNQVPMTAMCPAWLALNKDRKGYTVIKDRALTIKRIFDEAASGLGMYAITRRLNDPEKPTPHFGKSNGWRLPYVALILKNRAVLGEYQPHKYIDGKRVPVDENGEPLPKGVIKPIPYFYPKIIEAELFERVQLALASRQNAGAGRKGKGYSSLFSGLLKCEHCRATIYLENKGRERYLVCSNARSHQQCLSMRWRYYHFEHAVLYFLSRQIDLKAIASENKEQDKRYQLEAAIEGLQGKKNSLEKSFESRVSVLDTIVDANANGMLTGMLNAIGRELGETKAQLERLTGERNALVAEAKMMAEVDIKALVEAWSANPNEQERYKVRSDLAANLRKLVARIDVHFSRPLGALRAQFNKQESEYTQSEKDQIADHDGLSFKVQFKNGKSEWCLNIDKDDPFDPNVMHFPAFIERLEKLGYDVSDPEKAILKDLEDQGYDISDPEKAIDEAMQDMDKREAERRQKRLTELEEAGIDVTDPDRTVREQDAGDAMYEYLEEMGYDINDPEKAVEQAFDDPKHAKAIRKIWQEAGLLDDEPTPPKTKRARAAKRKSRRDA